MADRASASERLERVLHILPAATRPEGALLERLAADLGVPVQTVVDDLTEVIARQYYHPAGSGNDLQIALEPDRVSAFTTGSFQRPVKLAPLEALGLALGLRCGGMRDGEDRRDAVDRLDLLERVEAHLATAPIPDEPLEGIHAVDVEPDPDGVRELLVAGCRERRRCRILYLKPDDPAPDDRVIHPYLVAHSEGRWYVVAWCETADGARAFRLDRVLDAALEDGGFEPRPDVDPDRFLTDGRVFHADTTTHAVVRYSPAIARWITEWAADAQPHDDGSLVVRHRVSDPGWLVRHVVRYGGEAEVLEPAELREAVARAVGAVG